MYVQQDTGTDRPLVGGEAYWHTVVWQAVGARGAGSGLSTWAGACAPRLQLGGGLAPQGGGS